MFRSVRQLKICGAGNWEGGVRERGRESQKCAWKPFESCLILKREKLGEGMTGKL